MIASQHGYRVSVTWTGNLGQGTRGYRAYSRDHTLIAGDKPAIHGSADPAFRGDARRYNPEELLVGALSACHMLWYLHLCAAERIVVVAYCDDARGVMREDDDGGGRFVEVVLRPRVVVEAPSDLAHAIRLHERAHALCFIARSVSFPVRCEPTLETRA